MELYIYTGAPDKSQACATTLADLGLLIAALADPTAGDNPATLARISQSIPQLGLNDDEPLTLRFYSSASTEESWPADAANSVAVSLGALATDGTQAYATTTADTIVSTYRTGTLALTTAVLKGYIAGYARRGFATLWLHVRRTSSLGTRTTQVLMPVSVSAAVLNSSTTIPDPASNYYTAAEVNALLAALYATDAQAIAGTSTTKLVSPANLAAAVPALGTGVDASITGSITYFTHRGLPNVYPEHTMEAYRASVAAGAKFVEIDAYKLADGSLGCMHDDTIDRTTTGSGNVADQTAASWSQLTVDAGSFLGGGWGNLKAPLVEQIILEFGNKVPLLIECKDDYSGDLVLALLQRHGVRTDMAAFNTIWSVRSRMAAAKAAGYLCMPYTGAYSGSPSLSEIQAEGYTWFGVLTNTTPSAVDALRAGGINVYVGTMNTFIDVRSWIGHCDAAWTDDEIYLRGLARLTSDPFAAQTWYHGQQAANASGDGGGRGAFTSPDLWGYDMAAANTWVGALQGWASPMNGQDTSDEVTKLNSVVIDFSVKFVDDFSADRFAWVAITTADTPFASNATASVHNGYVFSLKKNGTVQIYLYTKPGVTTGSSLGSQTGTTITDGATATYRITVTATQLTLERTDVATSLTVTNSLHRGAFLHAGVVGVHAQFKDFIITFP